MCNRCKGPEVTAESVTLAQVRLARAEAQADGNADLVASIDHAIRTGEPWAVALTVRSINESRGRWDRVTRFGG